MKTRKRFGQHFLHDPGVLERIVEAIDPVPGDVVVEIGPGEGALTRPLLQRLGRLTAVEIDRDLAARLAGELCSRGLAIVAADALEHDFSAYPPGLRIVGNLPYNISTPLLFHLARYSDRVRDMHFLLQREVVERMVAKPSTAEYGRLSVALQVRFAMTRLFNVSPGAFRPPPKVESAVVRMLPLANIQIPEKFADVIRKAFSARRKTLRNALGLSANDFAELELDPQLRPENLTPGDYLRVARHVQAGSP